MDVCEVVDLGYIGLDWTFEKKIQNGEYCRVQLDRVLAMSEWSVMFPFASVRHLSVVKFVHSPIILINEMKDHNRRIDIEKPFRYERMWERHKGFQGEVDAVWLGRRAGSAKELHEKLASVASSLLSWGTMTARVEEAATAAAGGSEPCGDFL